MTDDFTCTECGAVRRRPPAAHGGDSPDGLTDPLCGPCARSGASCPEYNHLVRDGSEEEALARRMARDEPHRVGEGPEGPAPHCPRCITGYVIGVAREGTVVWFCRNCSEYVEVK